jgi:hypothetical protein
MYYYHAAVLLTSSLPDDGAFSVFGYLRIEDLDLHNLAVKNESSLLLISIDYLYQITGKYTCGITTSSKSKRFSFYN